jgi:hypothetical protein
LVCWEASSKRGQLTIGTTGPKVARSASLQLAEETKKEVKMRKIQKQAKGESEGSALEKRKVR